MSSLGEPFVYDVFFSYAWANRTEDPHFRDWCRKIADTISTLLKQRFNGDGVTFRSYLDRDQNKSGQDIALELQTASQSSAIFVAMVSDYYDSYYCQQEVSWFFDQLTANGAGPADHVCILRMQDVQAGKWPARLKGLNGAPLSYMDFCNASGQPIDMAKFVLNGSLDGLAEPVEKAAIEIADKLVSIRKRLEAKATYRRSQQRPDRPLLFFEAEAKDRERWAECGRRLKDVPSIVLPARDPIPANAAANGKTFAGCDGLVLLRSRSEDEIGDRIKSAYLQLRTIFRESEQTVPWALLDEVDEPPPESEAFDLPRVRLQGDWLPALQKALLGA
jgi:hypothetical protein